MFDDLIPYYEEAQQIVEDLKNRCLMPIQPQEIVIWERLFNRSILNNLEGGVAYYDNNLVLRMYSHPYGDFILRSTLISPEQALGRHLSEYNPGCVGYLPILRQVLESGQAKNIYHAEIINTINRELRITYWDAHIVPAVDSSGRVGGLLVFAIDVTPCNLFENMLRKKDEELAKCLQYLEEYKTALRVLIQFNDEDKKKLENSTLDNIKKLLCPHIEILKNTQLNEFQMSHLTIVESIINDITSPLSHNLSSKYCNLTPMEIQVANLVIQGKTSKEIAKLLRGSKESIEFHRNNIRKRLGLKKKKISLRSYMLSLQAAHPPIIVPHSELDLLNHSLA
jgi:DNA-binding CsgD family transcriptional regulator